jgi:hypothetical protein
LLSLLCGNSIFLHLESFFDGLLLVSVFFPVGASLIFVVINKKQNIGRKL